VVQIAISDHYMILVVRKINIRPKQNNRHKKVEIRNFKYFNAENFLMDLSNQESGNCWTTTSALTGCGKHGKLFSCQF
jgi:hypothetical protein